MLTGESLEQHRAEELRSSRRHVEVLEAELDRHRRLLGLVAEVAVGASGVSVSALIEAAAAMIGTDPCRPAWVEARERRDAEFRMDRVVDVLCATAPERRAA